MGREELLLDILTPIAKSWPSEHCLEANKLAIQVLGGWTPETLLPALSELAGPLRLTPTG